MLQQTVSSNIAWYRCVALHAGWFDAPFMGRSPIAQANAAAPANLARLDPDQRVAESGQNAHRTSRDSNVALPDQSHWRALSQINIPSAIHSKKAAALLATGASRP
jgi:hypothetical protein